MLFNLSTRHLSMLLLLALLVTPNAFAAKKKDAAAKQIQQIKQQMQQQLESQKAEMQAQFDKDKASLKEAADKSEKDASSLKGSLAASSKKAHALEVELDAIRKEKITLETQNQKNETNLKETQSSLEATKKSLSDTLQELQVAHRDLKVNEGQRKELTANLEKSDKNLAGCVEKNARLYGFGRDLIDLSDGKNVKDGVIQSEPFTQLKRVELENIYQELRDQIDEQHLQPAAKN